VPEAIVRRGAVAAAARQRGISLGERRDLGKIDLRCDPGDRTAIAAIGRALDLILPTEAGATARSDAVAVLWLGPDQWLITCSASDVAPLQRALREALGSVHAALTDVTDGRVAFRLAGPNARDALAKGCPLDFHPRAFAVGSCAQSLFAKVAVLIHLLNDDRSGGPTFDVYVGRSFSPYLWAWLEDAGREYGVHVSVD
jgi:sarcosine oxidase subunit gamma